MATGDYTFCKDDSTLIQHQFNINFPEMIFNEKIV